VPKAKDLAGERFGRLVVLSLAGRNPRRWLCVCDCGVEKEVRGDNLLSGHTTSCDCLRRERVSEATRSHGMHGTPAYRVWLGMRQRCRDPKRPNWQWYGGRGIQVCERWRDSFEAFFADMGEPGPGQTIERLDPEGPYSPENCVWADDRTQSRNRRDTIYVDFQGERRKLIDLVEEYGVGRHLVYNRLLLGWTPEEAILTPVRGRRCAS